MTERVTFTEWLASRPFSSLPSVNGARRMEVAWNTALRRGRESVPPGPDTEHGYSRTPLDGACVPVPVLEALASAWEDQAGRLRAKAKQAWADPALKGGEAIRRAELDSERASPFEYCARMLREAIAHGGQG